MTLLTTAFQIWLILTNFRGSGDSSPTCSVAVEEAEAEEEMAHDVLAKGDGRVEFGQVAAPDERMDAVKQRRDRPDAQHEEQTEERAFQPVRSREQRPDDGVDDLQRAAVEQVDEHAEDGYTRLVSTQRTFGELQIIEGIAGQGDVEVHLASVDG
jgi:hypothetical protein